MNGNSGSKKFCKRGHEFTPDNTRINPNGARVCRQCARFHKKNTYLKDKGTPKYKARVKKKNARSNNKKAFFIWKILAAYNLKFEDYSQMLIDQSGRCNICSSTRDDLCIDHNHITGQVRSLLCTNCNTLIGLSHESEDILLKSIEYLKKWK